MLRSLWMKTLFDYLVDWWVCIGNLMMIFSPVCMKRRLWVGGKKKLVYFADYQLPIGFQTTTRSRFVSSGRAECWRWPRTRWSGMNLKYVELTGGEAVGTGCILLKKEVPFLRKHGTRMMKRKTRSLSLHKSRHLVLEMEMWRAVTSGRNHDTTLLSF